MRSRAVVVSTQPVRQSTISQITTKAGTLSTKDAIALRTTGAGDFAEVGTVISGTGEWAGATGVLRAEGRSLLRTAAPASTSARSAPEWVGGCAFEAGALPDARVGFWRASSTSRTSSPAGYGEVSLRHCRLATV
jgi:hypothetical protein